MADLRRQADVRTVPLHGKKAAGRVALVDDGDYDLVMAYRWNLNEHPNPRSGRPVGPYAMTNIPQGDGRYRNTSMHTLITGWPRVDHADHNGLNNQRSNLRPATGQQNAANRVPLKGCASPFKGVFRSHRSPRWYAGIRKDGKRYHLGAFDTEEEAARAYDAAAKEMFGEYAYLNFP